MPISKQEISDLLQQTTLELKTPSDMISKLVSATGAVGDYEFEFSKTTQDRHIEYYAKVTKGSSTVLNASYSKEINGQRGQIIARELYRAHVKPLLEAQTKYLQAEAKKALIRPY